MSVSKFDPQNDKVGSAKAALSVELAAQPATQTNDRGITVTDTAQQHITAQLEQSGASQVRLGVKDKMYDGLCRGI